MARGDAVAREGEQQGLSAAKGYAGNAGSLYATLAPQLAAESVHPTGFDPATRARMETEAEQGAGGSNAAAVGQGALMAGRTRNAGSADAAIGEGTRAAGQELGKERLGANLADAELAQRKQAAARGEMGQLYGESANAGNEALGEVAGNANANTNAVNSSWSWAKDLFDPILGAASSVGSSLFKPK